MHACQHCDVLLSLLSLFLFPNANTKAEPVVVRSSNITVNAWNATRFARSGLR